MRGRKHMETAEEWATYLGTTVITEEEYRQLRDRFEHQEVRGFGCMPLDNKTPEEVDVFLEDQLGMGLGVLGVLPPYSGPVEEAPPFDGTPLWHHWEVKHRHDHTVRLVYVDPDPYPQLDDLAAVTLTPEVAVAWVHAQAKEGHVLARGARLVGPLLDVKAALMTAQEAYELIEHGTPPGKLGTVPGRLVTVVVVHGMFEVTSRARVGSPGYTPPQVKEIYQFMVCDSRKGGGGFWTGGKAKEIVLPEQE
jgi:hypothetical protein